MEVLERDAALATLAELLPAAAGQGRLAVVSGEAGVGKTTLVHCFSASLPGNLQVLVGACDPMSTPTPLGPLLDIAPHLGRRVAALLDLQVPPRQLFAAVLTELQATQQPHVLVFEDVHWADAATLDLLRFLARRIQSTPTLLIVTCRDDELGPLHPLRVLLGDIAALGGAARIRLDPLSPGAVARLAGDGGPDPIELHRRTGGNPFFVAETLAAPAARLPTSIRDAVLARVARLSPQARSALEAAAVLGARTEFELVERVAATDAEGLDACIEAGVLTTDGPRVEFRHELVREAVLDSLAPGRTLALHRAALRAMLAGGERPEYLARLAHHAEAAGDTQAVLRLATAAGRAAAQLGAYREAAAQFERALRYAADLPAAERASLLEAYAQACSDANRLEQALQARREAAALWHTLGETLHEGDALTRLAGPLHWLGETPEAEEASRASLRLLEGLPPSAALARACATQAGLRAMKHEDAEAIAWAVRAIDLAEQTGATEPRVLALDHLGVARLHSEDEQGRLDLEQSLALARKAGLDNLAALAYVNLASLLGEHYQLARAQAYLTEGLEFCVARDLDRFTPVLQALQALHAAYAGQWEAALRIALPFVNDAELRGDTRLLALLAAGRVWTRQGDPRARAALDTALEMAQPTGELQYIGPIRAARAEQAWWTGEAEHVRLECASVWQAAAECEQRWVSGELALWLTLAGEPPAARVTVAEPFARQLAGDCAAAADLWQERGCPYEAARALSQSDDLAHLQDALRIARELGAHPLAARIVQTLRKRGVRPASPRRAPTEAPGTAALPAEVARLSPREREIAALLARGCTNREIADRLVISERTTENHVQHILNRLGLRSRVQVAAWSVQHGLARFDPE